MGIGDGEPYLSAAPGLTERRKRTAEAGATDSRQGRAQRGTNALVSGILLSVSELSDAIEAVLRACDAQLRAPAIETVNRTPENVRALLGAGEDGVAFEILCENLYEDDIEVPRSLLLDLNEAAQRVGAAPGYIEPLLG